MRKPLDQLEDEAEYRNHYHCTEPNVLGQQVLAIQANVGTLVAAEVAVIGSAEYGDAFFVVGLLVSFLFHLMRTDEQT